MRSRSPLRFGASVAVTGLLLSGCSGDAGEPADPSPSVASSPSDEAAGSDGSSSSETLVLNECGTVRARAGDARRTEYLGDPVAAPVGRGAEYDLGNGSPAPTTRVGAVVTAPPDGEGDVEVSRGLERRIARAAGVRMGSQVGASDDGPGNSFTNTGPARDFVFVDYVMYRVARWSATDCLAFPGETVRGTLTYEMISGDAVASCDPDERRPRDPIEPVLREICPG